MPETSKMIHGAPLLAGPAVFFFARTGLNFDMNRFPSRLLYGRLAFNAVAAS